MEFFSEISTWIWARFSWKSRKVTSRHGWYWAPRAFSAMVHLRKVVRLVEKKIFRNFCFENFIFKIFFFSPTWGRFFIFFQTKKKLCSTQNRFYAGYRSKRRVESSRNPVSEVKLIKNWLREKPRPRGKPKANPAVGLVPYRYMNSAAKPSTPIGN